MLGWIALLLLFHLGSCALIIALSVIRLIRIRISMFPMLVLVPVIGPLCALFLGIHKRRNLRDAEVNVEKFKIENAIYQSMGMVSTDEEVEVVSLEEAMILNTSSTRRSLMIDVLKENVVPLEEALAISSSDVRRKLMMDVLTSDTAAFYSLLEQARLNDDVEVVHYATTAMSELNKKYDLMLQKCMKRYKAEPGDPDALLQYCDCLKQYLSLNLVQGQIAVVRRNEYIAALKQLVEQKPTEDNYSDLAQQQMQNEAFEDADRTLCTMEERYPVSENTWLLRLQFHIRQHHGQEVQRMIDNSSATGIYFSKKAREQMQFWSTKVRSE